MATPLLSYAEAARLVEDFLSSPAFLERPAPATQTLPLASALGRVLAAEMRADRDQPPFARSTRDGYAGRAEEINSGQFLALAGQLRAGDTPLLPLAPGTICEIMTGAPVPSGANCVLMIEHSEAHQQTVRLKAPRTLHPGENIVPRGAEARAGDLLVPAGVRIGPAHIAIAAQTGSTELAVFAQPRVAILSTGDELVSASDTPGPSQIRNSNGPMLAAMAAAAGGNPVILPTAPDREDRLNAVLAEILAAAPNFDLLLISGGISFGKFDLVADTLGRLGAEVLFAGVAIQPGKPVAFGQLPGAGQILPFFALPGNPLSSAVTFQLFAAPLLATLGGLSGSKPRFASAEFKGIWKGSPGLTRFLPAYCDFAPDQATAPHALPVQVRLVPWQGSGDIAAYARSNCFVVVPSQTGELQQGAIVPILLS